MGMAVWVRKSRVHQLKISISEFVLILKLTKICGPIVDPRSTITWNNDTDGQSR